MCHRQKGATAGRAPLSSCQGDAWRSHGQQMPSAAAAHASAAGPCRARRSYAGFLAEHG